MPDVACTKSDALQYFRRLGIGLILRCKSVLNVTDEFSVPVEQRVMGIDTELRTHLDRNCRQAFQILRDQRLQAAP
ncbi:hypothetical protein C482_02211, partial [Natrialba chahannaoensis JCM 10990]